MSRQLDPETQASADFYAEQIIKWWEEDVEDGVDMGGIPRRVIVARELLRIREALETWRAAITPGADLSETWFYGEDVLAHIDAILAPDTKETTK